MALSLRSPANTARPLTRSPAHPWPCRCAACHRYHGSGLAGGTYFRSAAILDAFSDEKVAAINFTQMMTFDSARVLSSDFAMPIALSMAGYTYSPWNDSISWGLGGCRASATRSIACPPKEHGPAPRSQCKGVAGLGGA